MKMKFQNSGLQGFEIFAGEGKLRQYNTQVLQYKH